MLTVKKQGRHVAAMVLDTPVNGVTGIAQCMIPGCEAHIVLLVDHDGTRASQIDAFMMEHDCNPNRFPARKKRGGSWKRRS